MWRLFKMIAVILVILWFTGTVSRILATIHNFYWWMRP